MAKYEPIVFEDSQGNIISNDPVFKAQQILAAAGVDQAEEKPKAKAKKPAAKVEPEPEAEAEEEDEEIEQDEEDDEDDDELDEPRDYKDLDGAGLKAYASENNIDIKGLTSAKEVRARFIQLDQDAAAQAEVNAANS